VTAPTELAGGAGSAPASPAMPPALAGLAARHKALIVRPLHPGGWRLVIAFGPRLTAVMDSPDPKVLERFAWAFDAWQRAEALMCTCGHLWGEHKISNARKACDHVGCPCTEFTPKGGVDGMGAT
jgi:hypothetical protein